MSRVAVPPLTTVPSVVSDPGKIPSITILDNHSTVNIPITDPSIAADPTTIAPPRVPHLGQAPYITT